MRSGKLSVRHTLLTGVAASVLALSTAAAQADGQSYDIEAQALGPALQAYALQSGREVFFSPALVDGHDTAGLNGTYSDDAALTALLQNAGLSFAVTASNAILIVDNAAEAEDREDAGAASGTYRTAALAGAGARSARQPVEDVAETDEEEEDDERQRDTITVTGTAIRGVVPASSPVQVFTSEDILETGSVTLDQFFGSLSTNVNSVTSTAAGVTNDNRSGANSIDLRGLGPGTTLVLINGRRMVAPGGVSPDISLIPLSSIDRVEILTDGASALYGSDAIGGVVNVILKEYYRGIEAGISYGGVTDGSHRQFNADLGGSITWTGGGATASYSFFDQEPLLAEDREFVQTESPYHLMPSEERHGLYASLYQSLGDRLELSSDILYSTRDYRLLSTVIFRDRIEDRQLEREELNVNASATYSLTPDHTLELFGSLSDSNRESETTRFNRTSGNIISQSPAPAIFAGDHWEVGATVDGPLLRTPAGTSRYSFGVGYVEEATESISSAGESRGLSRDQSYLFGEVFVPLISEAQNVGGIDRLEFTASARVTEYSDFGTRSVPRVGLLWSPFEGLALRGTYSEAFRAPGLAQLVPGPTTGYSIFPLALFGIPDPFSSDNSSVILLSSSNSNSGLGPETSESFTIGFDVDDVGIEGLSLSGTYFRIDYVDRIGLPAGPGGFAPLFFPETYASIITNPATPESVAELSENATAEALFNAVGVDPTDLDALIAITTVTIDNRISNIASSTVEGFDLEVDFNRETELGLLQAGASFAFLFESTIRLDEVSPLIDELNRPTQPIDFKFNAFVGLSRGQLDGRMRVNYTDSYSDPFQAVEVPVDSWTTLDANLTYSFTERASPFLSGSSVGLSVQNLLDQDPPTLGISNPNPGQQGLILGAGFDPVNASPLGRFVRLSLRKAF